MGGIVIYLGFIAGALILNQWTLSTIWVVVSATCFGLIGAIDDGMALIHGGNKGLSAMSKFGLQIVCSIGLVLMFNMWVAPIHWAMGILYVFLLTGTSNATNLTDGVDGLLGTTMMISLMGLLVVQQWMPGHWGLTIIMMGSIACFLIFNWHPAKVFMGDVGSLMLGGYLAAASIASGAWWILIGFGAIYIIETLSVIIQVISYKFRRKRVFLMTPLHHHFELLGMSDQAVVALFAALQGVFVVVQLQ